MRVENDNYFSVQRGRWVEPRGMALGTTQSGLPATELGASSGSSQFTGVRCSEREKTSLALLKG